MNTKLVFNTPNKDNKIFLTFDDGPHPEITPWIVQLLKKFDAKATFFVTGKNAEKHPDIIKMLITDGHKIGNHTYSHLNGWKTKNELYLADIAQCNLIVKSNLFRPPYGRITPSQIKGLKDQYKLIMWSDLSGDFDSKISVEFCISNATKKVKSGSIIVFHDSEKAWPHLEKALPICLEFYKNQGFEMDVIPT